MNTLKCSERFNHSIGLIIAVGWVVGVAINLSVTFSMYYLASAEASLSFFCGTLSNLLFQYAYYNIVISNRKRQFKFKFVYSVIAYLAFSTLAACVLFLLNSLLNLGFVQAVFVCIIIFSLASLVMNRITLLSSVELAEVQYKNVEETFYEDQADTSKVCWFRAWYHKARYARLGKLIDSCYRKGSVIADIGCGNCMWNDNHYPVVGVDINESMMVWAKGRGRLKGYHLCSDLSVLPLESKSCDIVVMSEVLEHVLGLSDVLREAKRVLKDDGVLLITVPYDFVLSPFFILFNLNCLYMWLVNGSMYHKYRCGHIHHFTKSRLRKLLADVGMQPKDIFSVNGFLIYACATKEKTEAAPSYD